jgi:dipeptidyl-peptidase 4
LPQEPFLLPEYPAADGFFLEENFVLRAAGALLSAFILFSVSALAQSNGIPLTVERIFAHEHMTGAPPEGLTWSPDGTHLTYLDGGELIDLDPGTGRPHVLVSRAKLAALSGVYESDQDRDHRERYKMANYIWAPDSKHLLFDSGGRLWLYDLGNGIGIQIGFTDTLSGDDPKFSPNGENVSFIRNHGLSEVRPEEITGAAPFPLQPPPNEATSEGEVDWVYEEELDVRSNYFWSPDSKNLAFLQMDEANVPQYPLTDFMPTHATVELQRYPQPGDPNPAVRVGVVSAGAGSTRWIRLPNHPGLDYVPRFGWVDRHTLWVETLSRDHKQRDLFFADENNSQSRLVLEITDDKFLDENYDVDVGGGDIVLTDWKDGHNHIYLYRYNEHNPMSASASDSEVSQLTRGDFDVDEVSLVDAAHHVVDYTSNEGNPLEQQVWQVGFDGKRTRLTTGAGFHEANFSPNGQVFVDTWSTRMEPERLSLCQTGGKCNLFWSNRGLEPYKLRPPEQMEVKAKDGSTLYATLLMPANAMEKASVPLIVNPYGGPGPQTVVNKWDDSLLFDELLAEHGFAVLHADNRGTGHRGRAFAQAAWHNFGQVQLEDQLTVLDTALAGRPELDPNRLGWWGWSWGGSFTLYAMTHSDRFKAGVAVAPVTDWRDYDSIYTERYLGQPSDFPEGYKDFSPVNSAAALKGHLLLAHGTGDDNVHIENTVQFIQRLIDAHIPYDLQIYPRKTHSIAGADDRILLFSRILSHFEEYLKPASVQEK